MHAWQRKGLHPVKGSYPDQDAHVSVTSSCRNYELLRTALQAYVAAGWGPRTIIIDNSPGHSLMKDDPVNHTLGSHCSPNKEGSTERCLYLQIPGILGLQCSALWFAGKHYGERDYPDQTLKAILLAAPKRHR